ncbi:hypothetical protein MMC25_002327 [Agyrium rufum]|nr:hypothetical protein [Agyrium rufum]
MFRNRHNSQKPTDDLYAAFKRNFPEVGTKSTGTTSGEPSSSSTSLANAITDPNFIHRTPTGRADGKDPVEDREPTTRGEVNDDFRFTPSLLDSNPFAFGTFSGHNLGYYTPTPGGINTLYHSQAGDLHTPGMGLHIGTPMSMSIPDGTMHAIQTLDLPAFNPHILQSHTFPQQSPFIQHQIQGYAPPSFVHQDSGYVAVDNSPGDDVTHDSGMQPHDFSSGFMMQEFQGGIVPTQGTPLEKFRFHSTLNAPTAMIRHPAEIPITYLNKGQAYSISVTDTVPVGPTISPMKYRTFVRVSFEDEQQRSRPSACWQLWKEGRGQAEAHQRNGRLQAVEYVDPTQSGGDDSRRSRFELESSSFDGFCVTWTPLPGATTADCAIAVRFNFLSTDFSHSKGVKGIPVRLCTKTEIVAHGTPNAPPGSSAEVCFCKVKLFRDHGAERKLSNDVAHVKKTIDKLKQQITQIESGIKDVGKRKRGSSSQGKAVGERPGKIQKHKRTWSMSSQNSGGRPAPEEDLHMKLSAAQDMFTSTRPMSVLYLRGEDQDDPDLHPVSLPGQSQEMGKIQSLSRTASWDQKTGNDETSPTNSCNASPSPSNQSLPSQPGSKEKAPFKKPVALELARKFSNASWRTAEDFSAIQDSPLLFDRAEKLINAVKVQKGGPSSAYPAWIEALEVDASYQAPPEPANKPVACFYVLVKIPGKLPGNDYYHAVYLMQRTVNDLIRNITAKCEIDPNVVQRVLRINPKGLRIIVDDEVVHQLPEGQDMMVEFADITTEPVKAEGAGSSPKALEMKLSY